MIPRYRTRANIGLGGGFLMALAGGAMNQPENQSRVAPFLVLIGLGVWIWGCQQYCRAKAQPGWKAIYGIVFPLGLIALVLLPDQGSAAPAKSRTASKKRPATSGRPRERRPNYDQFQ